LLGVLDDLGLLTHGGHQLPSQASERCLVHALQLLFGHHETYSDTGSDEVK